MADGIPHTPDSFSSPRLPPEGARRLAAIMFTDMKDFSKKMQVNETLMLRVLETHNRMMRQTVQKYRGTVIKTFGDAFLISFESVVDAASCALEVQQSFLDYNKDKPPEEKIMVRIGVHLGDIVVKDKDVFGDGVNIASRVQSMAVPGGVNITESVYQQVKNKLDIRVVKLGAPQLKGMKEAIRVYQVIMIPETKRRGKIAANLYVARALLNRRRSRQLLGASLLLLLVLLWVWSNYFSAPLIKSIAVLPFELLGSQEQEYLADGLSEEIISQLSRIPEILVISKASSFSFKGSNLDERVIARQLGVEYLLKGNVRPVAGQTAVVAILLEPTTGAKVWTESFAVSERELFQLQYEIPRQIARRFKLQFATKIVSSSPDVYDLYSRGLYERDKLTRENNFAAIGNFLEALKRDSLFVPARVGLVKAQMLNFYYGWDRNEENLLSVEQNCNEILKLDSSNAEAYATLGGVRIIRGDRENGMNLLRTALRHDARNYTALTWLGREHLFTLNEPGSGLSYLQRAIETDPTNFLLNSNIGVGYAMLKNYSLALEAFRRASFFNPTHDYPFRNLGIVFERSGQYDSALFYYRIAAEKNPSREDNYLLWGELHLALLEFSQAESIFTVGSHHATEVIRLLYDLGVAYLEQKNHDMARKTWEDALQRTQAVLKQQSNSGQYFSFAALISARLGETNNALALTSKAIEVDSTDSEIIFNAARVYAVLGKKKEMLDMFKKAKSMNPEYDVNYLTTAIDFERFRKDPELLRMLR